MPHFEIHVADVDAAKSFYGGLFGWRFTQMPGLEEVGYHLIDGDEVGADKGMTAALIRRPDQAHPAGSAVRGGVMVFDVADVDDRYAWALAHGGAPALPPDSFPEIGRFAYVEDGQGNIVGMITPEGEEAQ